MELFSKDLLSQLTPDADQLKEKILSQKATIGVVGLGYVGMPIALEFAKKGFQVIGMDVSEPKVEMLNQGENFIEDLKDEEIAQVVKDGFLKATTSYEFLSQADIIYICVPTPF